MQIRVALRQRGWSGRTREKTHVVVLRYIFFILYNEKKLKPVFVFIIFAVLLGETGEVDNVAVICQISRRYVEPFQTYGRFSICQDGNRRHLGFWKF